MSAATLLVVEDEAVVAADLQDQLQRHGYRVCGTAASGEEALALARRFRPQLVLMDIHIHGDLDGIQTATIMHDELDMPVIFLSAFSDEPTLERAKQATPHGFVVKPFDPHQLRVNIEVALSKHDHERLLAKAHRQIEQLSATLEQRVHERTEDLRTALGETKGVMQAVAHHMRSPLRAIEGYAQLLRTRLAYLPGETRQFPETIIDHSERLAHLIDDLLEYLEFQRQPVFPAPMDIAALAREVLADLIGERPQPDVQAVVAPLPPCQADPALLRRLLRELLANALQYSSGRRPPVITMDSQPDTDRPGHVVYFVRDNGIGFDPEHAGQLFDLFCRLNLPEDYPGTGAGLAISRRITERMGGRLWAESAPDQGATFFFSLPAATAEPPPR